MSWRKTVLPFAALMILASPALALPPILKIQQGPAGVGPCNVTVRILVDPQSNTIDFSQFTIRYKSPCLAFASVSLGANAPAGATVEFNDLGDSSGFPVCGPVACTTCSGEFDRHVVVQVVSQTTTYSGTGDKEIAVVNFTALTGGATCKVEWDQNPTTPSGLKPTFLHAIPGGDLFGPGLTFIPNVSPPSTCPALSIAVPSPTISGTVQYYLNPLNVGNNNPVPNVLVCWSSPPTACGTSQVTTGIYTITGANPGPGTLTPTRQTDPADPSSIGGGDVNRLIQALNFGFVPSADEILAGNLDGTPGLATTDLQKLRRYLLFDFAACPDCATWRFRCKPTNSNAPCDTTLLACTNLTKNLKGIFRGDIDGSWPARFKVAPATLVTLSFGSPAWLSDELRLSVLCGDDRAGISSAIFTLNYDADALEFLGADPGAAAPRFELNVNPVEPGTVHGLLTAGLERGAHAGELMKLRFRSRNGRPGQVAFSRLYLNDQPATALPAIEVAHGAEIATPPKRFAMHLAPNPFNPTTQVDYTIPSVSGTVPVALQVVDLSGRVVRELVRTAQGSGSYHTIWDGRDASGEALASGVYMIHLRAGDWRSSQKAVLLK